MLNCFHFLHESIRFYHLPKLVSEREAEEVDRRRMLLAGRWFALRLLYVISELICPYLSLEIYTETTCGTKAQWWQQGRGNKVTNAHSTME